MLSLRRYACITLLLCCFVSGAQTLAHPGWRGNGIASQAWWKHTAFIRFGEDTTFTKVSESMDVMSEAGADSMILPDLQPAASVPSNNKGMTLPFDSKFGTEDDLDALLREASSRRMHVLLRVDLLRLAGNSGELRFWMSRGIAGLDVGAVTPAQMDTLRLLRGAMDRFPGRRILLAETPAQGASQRGAQDPVTLHMVSANQVTASSNLPQVMEVHSADSLRTELPPNTALVVDMDLLQGGLARESLRTTLLQQGRHTRPYTAGPSSRRRSR